MTEKNTHEGGCQCGKIRYRVPAKPVYSCNCHCRQCQMAAGAPYIPWVEFPADQVTFTADSPCSYRSSETAERGFCPACGTALTFRYLEGDNIDIATVTLDDPAAFPPQEHIWTDSKAPWVNINDGLPQYPRGRDSG